MNKMVKKVYNILVSEWYINEHINAYCTTGLYKVNTSIVLNQLYLGCKEANITYVYNKGYRPLKGCTTKKSYNRLWNGIFQKRMKKAARKIVGAGRHISFLNDIEDRGGNGFWC